MVFCRMCVDCGGESYSVFRYQLTSELKLLGISLGYNGIIVGLKQNQRYLEIGGGFLGGSSTSWENF